MSAKKMAALALAGGLVVALVAWRAPGWLQRSREKQLASAEAAAFEKNVSSLKSRYGSNTARPVLPPEGAPKDDYPPKEEIIRYHLQIGTLFAPTDDDARWAMQVVRADLEWSPSVMSLCLPQCISGSPKWMKRQSTQVSEAVQAEVVTELVRAIMYPKARADYDERALVTNRCLQEELWRVPAIRDALAAVRQDPSLKSKPWIMDGYTTMDRALSE